MARSAETEIFDKVFAARKAFVDDVIACAFFRYEQSYGTGEESGINDEPDR